MKYRLKVTHASTSSLPGIRSLLERKLEEKDHFNANVIRGSPEIGNIFINYPGAGGTKEKIPSECGDLHFMKKAIQNLDLTRTPLLSGKQNDPITLYSEFGYGKLEMFILAPAENALLDFRKKWPKGEKIDMGAASAAILLVFRILG